jgi:hypothetical protein
VQSPRYAQTLGAAEGRSGRWRKQVERGPTPAMGPLLGEDLGEDAVTGSTDAMATIAEGVEEQARPSRCYLVIIVWLSGMASMRGCG